MARPRQGSKSRHRANVRFWRAPCKGGAFPVGENPTRQSLQPEAIGAVMEVTKWLNREQFGLARRHPLARCPALALWTVPGSAGLLGRTRMRRDLPAPQL